MNVEIQHFPKFYVITTLALSQKVKKKKELAYMFLDKVGIALGLAIEEHEVLG